MFRREALVGRKEPSPHFQQVLESVESLPPDDQALLIELVHRRLVQARRAELAAEIRESREDYKSGQVRRGTAADLMKELYV